MHRRSRWTCLQAMSAPRVVENSPANGFVVHLSATDRDPGDNGLVYCSMTDAHFTLVDLFDNNYKIMTSDQPVDREITSKYRLTVNGTDFGAPPMWTIEALDVTIDDVNDNVPRFTHPAYNFTMLENKPGAWIGHVLAVDPDDKQNGEVVYTVNDEASDSIQIDPHTGVITSLKTFDLTTRSNVRFRVVARDRGDPPSSSQSIVNVEVLSEQEIGEAQYINTFYVQENNPPMLVVGRITIPPQITSDWRAHYQLEGYHSNHFQIVNSTIYARRALDRELIQTYRLRVVARRESFPLQARSC